MKLVKFILAMAGIVLLMAYCPIVALVCIGVCVWKAVE